MASVYTKKTTSTDEVKETEVKQDSTQAENEQLKKQIEELQAQMKMMTEMMASVSSVNTASAPSKSNDNKLIPFINMTAGTYVLKGNRSSYTLEGQFAKRNFTLREAKEILTNMPVTFEKGYVYIADADFVEENDLSDAYKNILSDIQLKDLLGREPSYVIDVYKSASNAQKEIIIRMIEDKKISGQFVDANILVELGKMSGKDLVNMEPMPDSKEG